MLKQETLHKSNIEVECIPCMNTNCGFWSKCSSLAVGENELIILYRAGRISPLLPICKFQGREPIQLLF